jgi:predicted PurR-regulated permease PerM
MEKKGLFRNLAILMTVLVVLALLYFCKSILVPLATAGVIAMFLNPLLRILLARGVPKGIGIAICVLVFLSFFGVIAWMFSYQISLIAKDWPEIEDKLLGLLYRLRVMLDQRLDITLEQQREAFRGYFAQAGGMAGSFIGTIVSIVAKFFLTIIYLVLLLSERRRIEELILRYTREENRENARKLMQEAGELTGKYLNSQMKVMGIIGLLYAAGFYFGGVPYPLFLAIIAALFAIIPFIGNIIGGGLACLVALMAGEPSDALTVIMVIVGGQLLSDYVLQPLLIGTTVDLSPLVTIFSIIFFSALWGPIGALLALPLTAFLVAWFRVVPGLQPLGEFLSSSNGEAERRKRERLEKLVHRRKKNVPAVESKANGQGK